MVVREKRLPAAASRLLLAGVTVLDLSQDIAGAYATKLLAELGADVLMLEPAGGSSLRRAPPWARVRADAEGSLLFQYLGASKRSALLDPTREPGRSTFLGLVARADVLVEDMPRGTLASWGLGYETLSRRNPRLILTSVTPFGQDGPYRDFKGTDLVSLALSGLLYITGNPDREPLRLGGSQPRYLAGLWGAWGTLLALLARDRAGQGQQVDVSVLESLVQALDFTTPLYSYEGVVRQRTGSRHPLAAPFTVLRCQDGFITIAAAGPQQWEDLCNLMERPDLLADPRMATGRTRGAIAAEVERELERWFTRHTKMELLPLLQSLRIPAGPCLSTQELLADPQLQQREFFRRVEHPRLGALALLGPPYRFSQAETRVARAPLLGEHSAALPRESASTGPAPAEASVAPPGVTTLRGLRVLDLSHVWAGPALGQYLGDHGAQIIKVEACQHPDSIRHGYYPGGTPGERPYNRSGFFHKFNRNKLAITLDLTRPEGARLLRRLVRLADVLIENFTPRVMGNWGLDYEALRRERPDLIMISLSGFGGSGPYRDYSAFGHVVEALSGLTSLTGYGDGVPVRAPIAYGDPVAAVYGALAVLAAYRHRQASGRGQWIDLSEREAVARLIGEALLDTMVNGAVPGPLGNHDLEMAPQGVYPCRGEDHWVALSVQDDDAWQRLCSLLGWERFAADTGLRTAAGRRRRHDELDAALAAWTRPRDHYEAQTLLQAQGIAAGAVVNAAELHRDPHLAARGLFQTVEQPGSGSFPHPSPAPRLSATPGATRLPAPGLGEHNSQVLCQLLGLTAQEYRALETERVVGYEPVTWTP